MPDECKEELNKRLLDFDRRQQDKLRKCKAEVEGDTAHIAAELQQIKAMVSVMTESVLNLTGKASTMEDQLKELCEVNKIWNNYKGFRNTVNFWMGPTSWKFWLIGAAVVYAVNHNFTWPDWFKHG